MPSLPRFSRFRNTDVVVSPDGVSYYGEWRPPVRLPNAAERIYVVSAREIGRPDIIAFSAYGDESLWWYIMDYNGIHDPFTMKVGDRLRIPVALPALPLRESVPLQAASSDSLDRLPVPEIPKYFPPLFRRVGLAELEAGTPSTAGTPFETVASKLFNFGFPVPSAGGVAHFEVQVSLQPDFSSLSHYLKTVTSVERWSYYDHLANEGEGSYADFPESGVDTVLYQGQSVYRTFNVGELIAGATYYFRYRSLVDGDFSQWYAPPAIIV